MVPVMQIPLSLLEWGCNDDGGGKRPYNFRLPARKVTKMKAFVRAGGVLPPIIVFVEKHGFHVMEGRHRIHVHLDSNETTILAKVCKDREEAYAEYALEMEARK